jgi:hypothetical protein
LGGSTGFDVWISGGQNSTYYDTDQIHWKEEGHRHVGEDLLYPIILSIVP